MATIRWYATGNSDANSWSSLSTTAQAAGTFTQGWVVSTGATLNSEFTSVTGADRAATTFVGSTVPDGSLDTSLKDALRTSASLLGTFASGNWTFQFAVVSTVQAGAADGQIVFRLLKANADGSSATEITSAQQTASVMTDVGATDITGTLTFNPGAITLTNQYLFVQIAWKRTGAGGMTTTNIRLRTGVSASVGTTILSSDFTPATQAITTVAIASTSVVRQPVVVPNQSVTGVIRASTVQTFALAVEVVAPGGGLVVTDDFVASSALSANWTQHDSTDQIAVLASHGATCLTGFGSAHWNANTFSNDQYSEGVIWTGGGGYQGIGCRMSGSGGDSIVNGYLLMLNGGSNNLQLLKYVSGTQTVLAGPLSITQANGDVLRIEAEGTTIRGYRNGGLVLTATDSSLTSGNPGIGLVFGQQFETWEGGDLVVAGLVVTDPCSGASGTLLPGWTRGVQIGLGSPQYDGAGKMVGTQGAFNDARWTGDTFANDQYAEADYNGASYSGVGVRMASPGVVYPVGYFLFAAGDTYGNGLTLQLYPAGGSGGTVLQTFSNLYGAHKLRIEVEGTTIRCYVDGGQVGTDTVDTTLTSGAAGISFYNAGTGATLDNIKMGDLGAPTGGGDQGITGSTIVSTTVVRVPSATPGPVTVTAPTRASALQTFAMAIAVGAVSITGAHRASTISPSAPTVSPQSVTITAGYRATTVTVNAASVAPGPVSISTETRASTAQVFVPSAAAGPVSVTTVPITATQVFQPVVSLAGAVNVDVAPRPSTVILNPATITTGPVNITTATRPLTSQVFVASVATGPVAITTSTLPVTNQTFAPSIATGPITVIGSTRPTTVVLNAPSMAVGMVSVTLGYISATQVFQPIVGLAGVSNVGTVALPSSAAIFVPSITVGPANITSSHRSSTVVLSLPIVSLAGVVNVGVSTIPMATVLSAPVVVPGSIGIATATRATTATAYAPIAAAQILGANIGGGSLFAPALTGTLQGAHRASAAAINPPIIALAGITNVSGATISLTQVFAPVIEVGSVSVTTQTRSGQSQLFTPLVSPAGVTNVGGATVGSTSAVTAPGTTVGPVTVVGVLITSPSLIYGPTILAPPLGFINTALIGSGAVLTGPSFTTGPVSVAVAHRTSTVTVTQPIIALPGVLNVFGARVASTRVVNAPRVVNMGAPGFPEILTTELVSPLGNVIEPELQTGLLVSLGSTYTLKGLESGLLVLISPTHVLKETT